jgi:hypothetical protein
VRKTLALTIALFAFLLAFAPAAKAVDGDAEFVTAFKDAGHFLPKALMKRGYTTFGNLSFEDFIAKMDSVEIIPTGWFARPQQVGTTTFARSSAQWRRRDGKMQIAVNRKAWPLTPAEVMPVLAMHEYLGVMGFNDADYQISTGLWLLTAEETHEVMKRPEIKKIETDLQVAGNFNQGGISGVGGGGDFYGALIKMRGLTSHLDEIKNNQNPDKREALVNSLIGTLYDRTEVTWHLP